MTTKPKIKPNEPIHYAGYISPSGDLYSCPGEAHVWLAKDLVEQTGGLSIPPGSTAERVLDSYSWLKIQNNGEVPSVHNIEIITQAQRNMLGRLLTCHHHETPPKLIRDSPYSGERWLNGTAEKWAYYLNYAIWHYTPVADRVK